MRGAPDFSYASDKAEADRVCQIWRREHPEQTITWVRPCIVMGPNVDNYIVKAWINGPFLPVLDGQDEEFQLVHEDDVVSALIALLDAKAPGPFNLAGDGTMTWRQSGELIGQKIREISLKNMKRLNKAMWRLRVPNTDAPAGNLDFLRYPWVVSTEKLKAETGLAAEVRHARDLQGHDAGEGQDGGRADRRGPPRAGRLSGVGGRQAAGTFRHARALSSVGRAPARQAGGHWFEPSSAHSQPQPGSSTSWRSLVRAQ